MSKLWLRFPINNPGYKKNANVKEMVKGGHFQRKRCPSKENEMCDLKRYGIKDNNNNNNNV